VLAGIESFNVVSKNQVMTVESEEPGGPSFWSDKT
jgi:hypothetical protein